MFARQNVTADPPFSHLDLISCRNVLIYLATPLQKRVVPTFHYALKTPGYLLLGNAETIGEHSDLFELKDRAHRIYAKKASAARHQLFFHIPDHRVGPDFTGRRTVSPGPTVFDFQKEADRLLLGRYAPPGVLIDDSFNIIQFRGRTSRYLEAPAGEPTTNVLKMTREGLFLELRNSLAEAKKHNRTVRREGIRVRTDDSVYEVALEVVPIRAQSSGTCYLVLFQEAAPPVAPGLPPPERPPEAVDAHEIVQLRQELAATREYLQSMVEQQDAANEELRSANEEILSSNEELQSTNEELETAKEELQSANEELTTVNEQLQRRNQELDQVNNDLTNLLSSTNIPVIMVGADLRIRRLTPPAKRVLSLLPTDVGRFIGDLKPAVLIPDLETLISEVIEHVQPVEREVRDRLGRWFVLRVHPYRTTENKIEGAVLVLVDVDQMRRDQEDLRRQGALIELSQDAVIIRDAKNVVTFWNRGAFEMYGWTAKEAKGKSLDTLLRTDPMLWTQLNTQLEQSGTWEGELRQIRKYGSPVTVHCREVLVRDDQGNRTAVLAINRDVTERLLTLEALKEADRRKDDFLATLAHELRNPLAPIRNAGEIIRRAGADTAAISRAREILDRQVRQLTHIVEDLIDINNIVEQRIALHKERVALTETVETALETCRSIIEGRRHRLTVNLPSQATYIFGDRVRLAQILINLLNNAAKFTEVGGEISLTASTIVSAPRPASETAGQVADAPCGHVEIRVRDSGSGISAEQLPRIFEMFAQGRSSLYQGRTGLGVGLARVQSLAQMHGGSIRAHSDGIGKGSEFIVRLPLAGDAPLPDVTSGPESSSKEAATPRKRILIVDDSLDQLESLGMLLELMGHDVREAKNGEVALKTISDFRPDIALLDIGLPGMNGYDLARRIRQLPIGQNILLIAQTGWGQDIDRQRTQDSGFDYHLVKPVDPSDIDEVLRKPRPRDQT